MECDLSLKLKGLGMLQIQLTATNTKFILHSAAVCQKTRTRLPVLLDPPPPDSECLQGICTTRGYGYWGVIVGGR